MADRLEHPPHLSLPAFVQSDPQTGLVLEARLHCNLRGRGHAIGQADTSTDPVQILLLRVPTDLDAVDLRDSVPGVGEPLSHVSVVGEENEATGVEVETADREDRCT